MIALRVLVGVLLAVLLAPLAHDAGGLTLVAVVSALLGAAVVLFP